MGQKIHPVGFRLAVNKDWSSKWFAKSTDFATVLKQDIDVREYLSKRSDIEILKQDLEKLLGVAVHVNIEEIRRPELDAQIIADGIAQQLEKRVQFRRAMKRAMQNAMRAGAKGIKIMTSGRLNGADIARSEWYREGRVPLHTLRADVDYATSEALTTYGIIGLKVWVYKGEMGQVQAQPERENRRSNRKGGRSATAN